MLFLRWTARWRLTSSATHSGRHTLTSSWCEDVICLIGRIAVITLAMQAMCSVGPMMMMRLVLTIWRLALPQPINPTHYFNTLWRWVILIRLSHELLKRMKTRMKIQY